MLENTNSGTIYQLQGTIYRLMRWRVECKVKGQRTKVEAICYRHQPSLLAIAGSCICYFPLHPLVIIPTFLFPFYFIKGEYFTRGTFLHIYAMPEDRKAENGKCVCTRATNRVHTVGGVSSDTLLQVVHTPNRGCAHGREGMWVKTNEMYNYTIQLHKYAKLTVRESRIWVEVFFWTKISKNFE